MKIRRGVIAMLLCGVGVPAAAHHSFAVFDMNRTIALEGTVKAFRYTNPHVWIDFVVLRPDGTKEEWGVEAGPPSQLRKEGWSATIVKPGDKIRAVLHPRRDGVHAGSFQTLSFADGTPVGKPRAPRGKPKAARKPEVDLATVHPLLRPLVPMLKFGFYHQPGGAPEGRNSAPSTNPRDLAGRYFPDEATLLAPGEQSRMLPYNDAGAKIFLKRANDMIEGKLRADPLSLCKPGGAIRAMNQGFPVQIAQTPTVLTLIHMEDHVTRRIRIGGTHPVDLKPSYMGDSIGHWEGNVLVVDTIGFRDGWMDEYGSPSSAALHLVERISKAKDGSVKIDASFTDPTYYKGSVAYARSWKWQPTVSWDEVICEENNRDAPPATTGKGK